MKFTPFTPASFETKTEALDTLEQATANGGIVMNAEYHVQCHNGSYYLCDAFDVPLVHADGFLAPLPVEGEINYARINTAYTQRGMDLSYETDMVKYLKSVLGVAWTFFADAFLVNSKAPEFEGKTLPERRAALETSLLATVKPEMYEQRFTRVDGTIVEACTYSQTTDAIQKVAQGLMLKGNYGPNSHMIVDEATAAETQEAFEEAQAANLLEVQAMVNNGLYIVNKDNVEVRPAFIVDTGTPEITAGATPEVTEEPVAVSETDLALLEILDKEEDHGYGEDIPVNLDIDNIGESELGEYCSIEHTEDDTVILVDVNSILEDDTESAIWQGSEIDVDYCIEQLVDWDWKTFKHTREEGKVFYMPGEEFMEIHVDNKPLYSRSGLPIFGFVWRDEFETKSEHPVTLAKNGIIIKAFVRAAALECRHNLIFKDEGVDHATELMHNLGAVEPDVVLDDEAVLEPAILVDKAPVNADLVEATKYGDGGEEATKDLSGRGLLRSVVKTDFPDPLDYDSSEAGTTVGDLMNRQHVVEETATLEATIAEALENKRQGTKDSNVSVDSADDGQQPNCKKLHDEFDCENHTSSVKTEDEPSESADNTLGTDRAPSLFKVSVPNEYLVDIGELTYPAITAGGNIVADPQHTFENNLVSPGDDYTILLIKQDGVVKELAVRTQSLEGDEMRYKDHCEPEYNIKLSSDEGTVEMLKEAETDYSKIPHSPVAVKREFGVSASSIATIVAHSRSEDIELKTSYLDTVLVKIDPNKEEMIVDIIKNFLAKEPTNPAEKILRHVRLAYALSFEPMAARAVVRIATDNALDALASTGIKPELYADVSTVQQAQVVAKEQGVLQRFAMRMIELNDSLVFNYDDANHELVMTETMPIIDGRLCLDTTGFLNPNILRTEYDILSSVLTELGGRYKSLYTTTDDGHIAEVYRTSTEDGKCNAGITVVNRYNVMAK